MVTNWQRCSLRMSGCRSGGRLVDGAGGVAVREVRERGQVKVGLEQAPVALHQPRPQCLGPSKEVSSYLRSQFTYMFIYHATLDMAESARRCNVSYMLAPAELSTLLRQAGFTVNCMCMCETHARRSPKCRYSEGDVRARMPSGICQEQLPIFYHIVNALST